ncbi:thioredoxin family protein [Candidatus Woesearchaeota archaeon]|nr:thioredoxin family protein [Candidatus Woesearchaeota archaeon]
MTITVYSTPTCPYCHMLKDHLKKKGVKFQDVDVSKDHEAAHRMISKSGQMGVPQTEINGKIIIGFDQEAIDDEIKAMASKASA